MKRKTVLIDFFGPDPKTTLLEYRTILPDVIYLLASDKYTASRYPEDVRKTVLGWKNDIIFNIERIDDLDLKVISERILEYVNRETGNGNLVYIDLTGGHELMIAAALSICEGFDHDAVVPVILDHEGRNILSVFTREKLFSTIDITLDDYFSARGAKRLKTEEFEPLRSDYSKILSMARYIFSMYKDWNRLNQIINYTHLADTIQFSLPPAPVINGKKLRYTRNMRILIDKFISHGFIIPIDEYRYKFRDNYVRDYMVKFGNWLEMTVYIRSKEVFDESYMSVEIDWNISNGDHVDNEIDVVGIKDSIPYFISCKMREVTNYDVYEVGFLASRLAGPRARSAIATTFDIDKSSSKGRALETRLKNMNVGLITAESLVRDDSDWKRIFIESRIK